MASRKVFMKKAEFCLLDQEKNGISKAQNLGYLEIHSPFRAVYRNFAEGGRIWGMDKRGGARRVEAQ